MHGLDLILIPLDSEIERLARLIQNLKREELQATKEPYEEREEMLIHQDNWWGIIAGGLALNIYH